MRTSIPKAVRETISSRSDNDPVYWFDQDLTIDELRRTVAVINTAIRASRGELCRSA